MRTETIEKTIYTFEELSDSAKENAREWWRTSEIDCGFEADTDDFVACANILGISIATRSIPLMGGGYRQEPSIFYSGFSSQGDGACFVGWYKYQSGARKAIRAYAPNDKTLHTIADRLQAIQKPHFYQLFASVSHHGRYYHEMSTSIDVEDNRDKWRDIDTAGEEIADCLRDFMRWMYRQLEAEYEHRMSDENVDESIRCNEYEFDENGRIH